MRFLLAPSGCQGLVTAIGVSQQLGNGKLLTNGPVCYGNAVLHVDIPHQSCRHEQVALWRQAQCGHLL